MSGQSRQPLLLVGAGGLAREVLAAVAAQAEGGDGRFRVLGVLDDDPAVHGQTMHGTTVLGPIETVAGHPDAQVVLCTGGPRNWWSRRAISARLGIETGRYATIIHPGATLGTGTTIGPGSVVLAGTVATADVHVGTHVVVMPGVILTHDDSIADHVTFASGVRLGGGVTVDEGAYLGAGSQVREQRRIGSWAMVGMGALVLDDVPAHQVWVGAPARFLRPSPAP